MDSLLSKTKNSLLTSRQVILTVNRFIYSCKHPCHTLNEDLDTCKNKVNLWSKSLQSDLQFLFKKIKSWIKSHKILKDEVSVQIL